MGKQYTVRTLKIGRTEQMDALAHAAGELYSQVVVWFWRTVRRKNLWLRAKHLMRWLTSTLLHAHSCDAIVQSFFAALASWRARRKEDSDAHPPQRRKWFYPLRWKASAIRINDGHLFLSNGKGNTPLVVPWAHGLPCQVEMGWDREQYELRATYVLEPVAPAAGEAVVGVDLGEVHPAVAHDGKAAIILNGRYLRSIRRYQNKTKGTLSAKIDRTKKGSRRRKRLVRTKKRQLGTIAHQIRDIAHKQTSALVSTLESRGVQTVAIGDIRDIRKRTDWGHKGNQRLHQMPSGIYRFMLTYKCERRGMQVVIQDEAYTSQSCPFCGKRHKPGGQRFRCPRGYTAHRDVVGAYNVRHKYLGASYPSSPEADVRPVVAAMASATGVRYQPHLRCSSVLR